jgi:hypothetical protein
MPLPESLPSEEPRGALRSARRLDHFLLLHRSLTLGLFTLVYLGGTALRLRGRPFWYYEILSLAAATQPTFSEAASAARTFGSSAPFPAWVGHLVYVLLGSGPLVSRLPGIIGLWVFCLCLFRFAARRVAFPFALAALLLPFANNSYEYAFEARSYGAILGFGGFALICWQSAATGGRRALAIAGLVSAIVGAIGSTTPGGRVTCESRSRTRSRFQELSVSSSKTSLRSDRPKIENERRCAIPGIPFMAISSGIVTCCSICSAEIPGHCVMIST